MASVVHASLALTGPAGAAGRDVLRGAQLALERAEAHVDLTVSDSHAEDVRTIAMRAAVDPRTLAYLGDFHSRDVMRTASILGDAELLQVAPVATFTGLGGSALVRLMPDDRMLAQAIARWLTEAAVRELLVVHDHDSGYGVPVGRMCVEAAAAAGVHVRGRPVWDHDEQMTADLGGAHAVLYVGVAGSGATGLWNGLHALDADLWLLGTDGVAAPWLAREMSAGAAARTRFFGAQRAPWGFYGYEAMALILDALVAGDGDRGAIARAARATHDRDSALGRYSIDADGLTTQPGCGCWTVVDGALAWER